MEPNEVTAQYGREISKLSAMYSNESDRAAAVLAVSFLDFRLGEALRGVLVDDDATRKMLGRNIRSFEARIELAYCLGYLPRPYRDDMHKLRDIRNYFAHHPDEADFSSEKVKSFCEKLELAEMLRGMSTLREQCLMVVAACLFAVTTGVRIDTRPTVPGIAMWSKTAA